MALVSGRSSLNPNAPLFIPAALRQVEDFSPEWWNLVTTSTWFREYWLSEHDDEDFFGSDGDAFVQDEVVDLLPDTFDLSADDEFSGLEGQFEEFTQYSECGGGNGSFSADKRVQGNGGLDVGADAKNLSLWKSSKERGLKSPFEPSKQWEKPAQYVNSKCSPRRIQQPR